MKKYTGVIFDLDGTLTRTNDLIFASFNYVARKYAGRTFSPSEITAMFGPPEESAIERIVGVDRSAVAMADFLSFYDDNHAAMASIYGGMEDVLKLLHSNAVRMAIFTGKGKRTAAITLERLHLSAYFDLVISGSDVEEHKPSPEGIRLILNRFGCPPADVLMVGDSVSDIKAARGAGVGIASVVWDSYAKESVKHMGADYLFHSVEDFSRWIGEMVDHHGGQEY